MKPTNERQFNIQIQPMTDKLTIKTTKTTYFPEDHDVRKQYEGQRRKEAEKKQRHVKTDVTPFYTDPVGTA